MQKKENLIKRRTVLKLSAAALGGTLLSPTIAAVMSGCKTDNSDGWTAIHFDQIEIRNLEEIAERILPKTETPGAKDLQLHRFMDQVIGDCYEEEDQRYIGKLLHEIEKQAKEENGKSFYKLKPVEQDQIIQQFMEEAYKIYDDYEEDKHPMRMLRELVVVAYFTNEEIALNYLQYDSVPGPMQGCIPYDSIGGVWALGGPAK